MIGGPPLLSESPGSALLGAAVQILSSIEPEAEAAGLSGYSRAWKTWSPMPLVDTGDCPKRRGHASIGRQHCLSVTATSSATSATYANLGQEQGYSSEGVLMGSFLRSSS